MKGQVSQMLCGKTEKMYNIYPNEQKLDSPQTLYFINETIFFFYYFYYFHIHNFFI